MQYLLNFGLILAEWHKESLAPKLLRWLVVYYKCRWLSVELLACFSYFLLKNFLPHGNSTVIFLCDFKLYFLSTEATYGSS